MVKLTHMFQVTGDKALKAFTIIVVVVVLAIAAGASGVIELLTYL